MNHICRFLHPLFYVLVFAMLATCQNDSIMTYDSFEDYPVYEGKDLGLTYSTSAAVFKVWAPTAEAMRVHLYEKGIGGEPLRTLAMERAEQGVWELTVNENLNGQYYAFQAQYAGEWNNEVTDPYAKAVGVNGLRGQVLDLLRTNPKVWHDDTRPPLNNFNEIIVYELHVRDMTIHPSSGSGYPGEYYGLLESGTHSPEGAATGLEHLKELGVTHIHLIPVFDHRSVDENRSTTGAMIR
jgi:pullulanase